MKHVLIAGAALASALSLSACQTLDVAKLTSAINDLDKTSCYKHVEIKVTPMLLFGWYVPIISGSLDKTCHPELAPAGPPAAPIPAGLGAISTGNLIIPAKPSNP